MRVRVGAIAAAIAVPLVFGGLRRLFPAAEAAPGDESLEELRSVHGRTEVAAILVFVFALIPLCSYAWWLLLVELAAYNAAGFRDAVAVVTPGGLYWVMVAALPGAITATLPAELFVRLLTRGRYREWLRYLELKHGFRQDGRVAGVLLFLLAVPALILVLLTLNWYFVLTEDEIRVNPWLSSERVYRYDEVAAILMDVKRYEDSDYVRRVYVVAFTDEYSWRTTPGLIGGRQDRWSEIARIVSRRSGVTIKETDLPEP